MEKTFIVRDGVMSDVAIVRLNTIQNLKLGSLFEFLNSDTMMSSFSDDSCCCYPFYQVGL